MLSTSFWECAQNAFSLHKHLCKSEQVSVSVESFGESEFSQPTRLCVLADINGLVVVVGKGDRLQLRVGQVLGDDPRHRELRPPPLLRVQSTMHHRHVHGTRNQPEQNGGHVGASFSECCQIPDRKMNVYNLNNESLKTTTTTTTEIRH